MLLTLFFSLLGVTATQSLAVKRAFDCGSKNYLTQNNGTVVSHGGFAANHNYGKNMDCIWTIEAPEGQHVELVKQSFDVEYDLACTYDYLQIFDGNSTNSPSLGKFCGTTFNPITSTGRFLTLQFITDLDTQQGGFSLFYNFTAMTIHNSCAASEFACANGKCIDTSYRCDNDDDCGDDSDEQNCQAGTGGGGSCVGFKCGNGYCIPLHWLCDGSPDCTDNTDELSSNCNAVPHQAAAMCGATNLTGDAGTIISPNNPNIYPNNADCTYFIKAPLGTQSISFTFDGSLSIEADTMCSYDFVRVYSDGQLLSHGPFCGNVAPQPFTIPGDHAYVNFVSDDSDNYSGFRLDWKAVQ